MSPFIPLLTRIFVPVSFVVQSLQRRLFLPQDAATSAGVSLKRFPTRTSGKAAAPVWPTHCLWFRPDVPATETHQVQKVGKYHRQEQGCGSSDGDGKEAKKAIQGSQLLIHQQEEKEGEKGAQ